MALEVFLSYSHRDEELRDELMTHLRPLERQGLISGWHDRKIFPGHEWNDEIHNHLETAHIILLLISHYFISSSYCYDVEMSRAIERHKNRDSYVIPIILRRCHWQGAPFGKLQALPKDAKPATSWANRDEAFTNVVSGIIDVINKLSAETLYRTHTEQCEEENHSTLSKSQLVTPNNAESLETEITRCSRLITHDMQETSKFNESPKSGHTTLAQ